MSDNDFGFIKEKLLIEHMLSDEVVFQRCHNILKPAYFDTELKPVVKCILKHSNDFNALPTLKQIKAETGSDLELIDNIRDQDQDWALTNIETFCQRGAIIQAVLAAPDLIDVGNYGSVETLVREATTVGLQKDLGIPYFEDPRGRLERMRLKNLTPCGFHIIDRKLYGGLNKGELTVFAAASGGGKSLFLQNICLNWVEGASYLDRSNVEHRHDPMTVVYITLELSEELTSKRLDTMVTGIDAREIFRKLDDVELKVRMKGKTSGHLRIKYMPGGSTINDIKAYLKEFEIQTGLKVDALAIDYLDLLHPISKKIDFGDLFIKDKYVTEEMRSLAVELDVLCITASQLNRSAVDQTEHNHAMIGGGLSKIQTADNVISIYMSPSMRERGEYQCQFLKTRSSAGVDSKVLLGFDDISLRITNLDEEEMLKRENKVDQSGDVSTTVSGSASSILQQIKQKPAEKEQPITPDPTPESTTEPELSAVDRLKRLQDKNLL